jgi:hypothetical protein
MPSPRVGYQPRNTPAERRAFFDVQRTSKDDVAAAITALRDEIYYTRRFSAYWQYSNTAVSPPGVGQLRSNVPLTMLYISKTDTDGYNRAVQLDFIPHGALIRVRGTTGNVFELRATGDSTDHGTWFDLPVSVISGTAADKGFRVELTMFSGIWAEDPPT